MKRAEFKCQGDEAEVFLYGEIGDFWGEGISAKEFIDDLAALGNVKMITVRINSPGGNVFDAAAMLAALHKHPAEIRVEVDGLAASAASVIAMAGATIVMAQNALMMIHHPSASVWGTAGDLRRTADLLDKLSGTIIDGYVGQVGDKSTRQQIEDWMTAETWFSAQEAVDAGLADVVAEPLRVAAMVHPARYKNAPRDMVSDQVPGPDATTAWRLAAARRELMLLG